MWKKNVIVLVVALVSLLFLSGCIITAAGSTRGVVRENEPPVVSVRDEDPELVVISGTYVYWLEGQDDVFFYGGFWWRLWGNTWYRSDSYRGRWSVIKSNQVPHTVRNLPPNWRNNVNNTPRVRWTQTRQNWRGWENDRYWEKRKWKRDGRGGRR
jgi:hypothetical protein